MRKDWLFGRKQRACGTGGPRKLKNKKRNNCNRELAGAKVVMPKQEASI